jgi:hypothetical protein
MEEFFKALESSRDITRQNILKSFGTEEAIKEENRTACFGTVKWFKGEKYVKTNDGWIKSKDRIVAPAY